MVEEAGKPSPPGRGAVTNPSPATRLGIRRLPPAKPQRRALARGEAPIASHLLYPQVLDDADPFQRQQGIAAGLAWGVVADVTVVYLVHGISAGMQQGIEHAEALGRPVEWRHLGELPL
jgi:hypothetical protein